MNELLRFSYIVYAAEKEYFIIRAEEQHDRLKELEKGMDVSRLEIMGLRSRGQLIARNLMSRRTETGKEDSLIEVCINDW